MLVIAAPNPEQTVVSGGSWYAYGQEGEQLAVLVPGEDGSEARELEPGEPAAADAEIDAQRDPGVALAARVDDRAG